MYIKNPETNIIQLHKVNVANTKTEKVLMYQWLWFQEESWDI
jgi:hypothetical protein